MTSQWPHMRKETFFQLIMDHALIIKKLLQFPLNVIELNNYQELFRMYNWKKEPLIDETQVHQYQHPFDVNQRRLHDAQCIMTICANAGQDKILEIGTGTGVTTASIALNAPHTQVYTVNIPPEAAKSGEGGHFITEAYPINTIGQYFREKKISNITQIYANTLTWEPNVGAIDVAFIDGCHDKEFVINDTLKVLPHMKPGGFVLWHDFNPDIACHYPWMSEVCFGIDWLCRHGHLPGYIYHLRDSLVGFWRVPEDNAR